MNTYTKKCHSSFFVYIYTSTFFNKIHKGERMLVSSILFLVFSILLALKILINLCIFMLTRCRCRVYTHFCFKKNRNGHHSCVYFGLEEILKTTLESCNCIY